MEGILGTNIFVFFCIAAEVFTLYCLFHFGQELKQESRLESVLIASPKSNFAPPQLLGHTQIVVWSVVACDYSRSTADSESLRVRSTCPKKEYYDVAA